MVGLLVGLLDRQMLVDWMDGWMDRWMDGWMLKVGWLDGLVWTDRQIHKWYMDG